MPKVDALSFRLSDQRGKKDALLRSLPIFSIVCLGILAIEAVLYAKASPHTLALISEENFWYLNAEWNAALLRWMYYTLAVGLAISTVGITINFQRLKRDNDTLRIDLLSMWIFFILGMVLAVL